MSFDVEPRSLIEKIEQPSVVKKKILRTVENHCPW